MRKLSAITFVFMLLVLVLSCSTNKHITNSETISSENAGSSKLVETINMISPSILKIDVLGFYKTWYFKEEDLMRRGTINFDKIDAECIFSEISSESVSGTAIVLSTTSEICGMITCAHIVDFPDTLYTYHDLNKTIIRSVSIKQEQNIYESGKSLQNDIEIIAMDAKTDLAFLKRTIPATQVIPPPFSLKKGKVEKLQWGSKIYVLGYSLGKFLITEGIVSVDKSMSKRFISDALFNKGISGSPVFGIQEGSTDYVWLGMASSSASQSFDYLEPKESTLGFPISNKEVYEAAVVKNKQLINYGVTYSISIEEIVTFVDNNKLAINLAGFDAELIISK